MLVQDACIFHLSKYRLSISQQNNDAAGTNSNAGLICERMPNHRKQSLATKNRIYLGSYNMNPEELECSHRQGKKIDIDFFYQIWMSHNNIMGYFV